MLLARVSVIVLSFVSTRILSSSAAGSTRHSFFDSPFLAPWKKNLTTKTCSAAMPAIIRTSTSEKLKILDSVLLTVLKFLFSLVLKYFCILLIVLSWPLTLKIVSSSWAVWALSAPPLVGIVACFCSSSTYSIRRISHCRSCPDPYMLECMPEALTAISKSTILSAKVDISLLKQNLYSPVSLAVNT